VEALKRHTVEELKKLLALLPVSEKPARKGELVAHILGQMEGEGLRRLWSRLDELQRAAVAETVHSPGGRFDAQRFKAKYGRSPDWGTSRDYVGYLYDYQRRPSLLYLFICRDVVPDDLRAPEGVRADATRVVSQDHG
jgi:hypothetical protein